jgi:hypothetical protein
VKTIQGESYEIVLETSDRVSFRGALRLTGSEEYGPILDLLKSTVEDTGAGVTIDLRELNFLNSSGITMLSRFVIYVRDRAGVRLEFLASGTVPWHARSLMNLQRLMPSLSVLLN